MRYQLIRTSPYLGGQVRWDIPLYYHYTNGVHEMDTPDLYLSPLSDNLMFNESDDRITLKYSHLDNLKYLYSKLGDSFYSSNGEYTGNYWLYNHGYIVDPYTHTYNMGTRRMRFSRYEKQFAFLCPLWISEETNPYLFEFEISIGVVGKERDHIAITKFKLSDAICRYMKNYLDKSPRYVDPDPVKYPNGNAPYQGVNDDLLSIKFNPDYATIAGVNVEYGKYLTKDISYIIPGLLHREVPLMEFDNLLLYNFKENHMIAQQLINLNFVFNMEDISFILKEKLQGEQVTISLRVLYDGEYLDIKDLYTNYENIPVYRADLDRLSTSNNVLDYLHDDKIIDYKQINKFTQPIFHWSMVENPGYIYNFYDGFAPTFIENKELYRISGRYYDQADILQPISDVYNNANHWCKYYNYKGYSVVSINTYIEENVENYSKTHSQIIVNKESGIIYINNNRFFVGDDPIIENLEDKNVYLANYVVDSNTIGQLNLTYSETHDGEVYGFKISSFNIENQIGIAIDLFATSTTMCTIQNIRNYFSGYSGEYLGMFQFIEALKDKYVKPYKIDFKNTTYTQVVEPFGDYHPLEMNMYKDNNPGGMVLRYTGKLCPLFIDPQDEYYKNINYKYNQWTDINSEDVQYYNKMIKTGYLPNYPSLDYYTFESEIDTPRAPEWYSNYEGDITWKNAGLLHIFPERYTTSIIPKYEVVNIEGINSDNTMVIINGIEVTPQEDICYKNITTGKFYILVNDKLVEVNGPEYHIKNYDEYIEERLFWSLLYDKIKEVFKKDDLSLWFKQWLKEIYTISYNFDYVSETDVKNIEYFVTFTLR